MGWPSRAPGSIAATRCSTSAGQDPGFVRELFSPALIAWLEREPPPGFSFELNEGNLSIGMPGQLAEADLARLCDLGAEVAGRIRAEIEEEDRLDADSSTSPRSCGRSSAGSPSATGRRRLRASGRRSPLPPPERLAQARGMIFGAMWRAVVGGGRAHPGPWLVHPIAGTDPRHAARFPPAFAARRCHRRRPLPLGYGVDRRGSGWRRSPAATRLARAGIEDRWRFHAAHRDLAVPGFADHVLTGSCRRRAAFMAAS